MAPQYIKGSVHKLVNWHELESKYMMHTVERVPLTLVKGEGARVWDENGREYLDLVAGWAVNSLGHCHPVIAAAVAEQANTLIQASNQFYTIPQIQLALFPAIGIPFRPLTRVIPGADRLMQGQGIYVRLVHVEVSTPLRVPGAKHTGEKGNQKKTQEGRGFLSFLY